MSERTPNEIRATLEAAVREAVAVIPRQEVELIVATAYAPEKRSVLEATEFDLL